MNFFLVEKENKKEYVFIDRVDLDFLCRLEMLDSSLAGKNKNPWSAKYFILNKCTPFLAEAELKTVSILGLG